MLLEIGEALDAEIAGFEYGVGMPGDIQFAEIAEDAGVGFLKDLF